jgi:protein-tyrosine phosphatase
VATREHVPGWIELTGAHNVRDVGGLPAVGGTVRRRVLLRGDNLDSLTTDDVALLRDEVGLRGVVDLRAPHEGPRAAEWVPNLGITWLHESLVDFTGLTTPQRSPDDGIDWPEMYRRMLEVAGPVLARILAFLVSDGHTPALLHCAAGKDRTGIATSVLLAVAGVERDAIVADYLATEQRIDAVRVALSRGGRYGHLREGDKDPALAQVFAVDPRAIAGVLDVIDAAPGGPAGFLTANGADPEHVSRWRDMIIEPN